MNTRHILMAAIALPVLALTGCDTTEEGFHPGNKSDIKLGVASTTLEFAASKGSSATLGITGNSKWTIDCNDSHFSFSQKSGAGATDVTVTTTDRNPDKTYTISFNVIADDTEGLNLNQQVTLTQEAVQISDQLTPSFTSYPEEGAEQEIKVKCTVGWVFNVEGTAESKAGFHVTPESGAGSPREFPVILKFDPNYTQQERTVSVTFDPSNAADQTTLQDKLPPAIILTQAAGTLPKDLVMTHGTPGYTECQVSLKFESKAPIEQCGVVLNGTEIIVAPLASPDSRDVTWTLTGLTSGARYSIKPFVTSKVGRIEGDAQEIKMDAEAWAPEIRNVTYDIEARSVTANITFESGMTVTNVGLRVQDGLHWDEPFLSKDFALMEGTVSVSTADMDDDKPYLLSPNTEYEVCPFVIYKDPDGVIHTMDSDDIIKIRTKTVNPSEDDNEPIP